MRKARTALSLAGVLIVLLVILLFSYSPRTYQPAFRLSVLRGKTPIAVRQTPYRTEIIYRVDQMWDDVAKQVQSDLAKQRPAWTGRKINTHSHVKFLDGKEPNHSTAESITISAAHDTLMASNVTLASPLQKPSRLELLIYEWKVAIKRWFSFGR